MQNWHILSLHHSCLTNNIRSPPPQPCCWDCWSITAWHSFFRTPIRWHNCRSWQWLPTNSSSLGQRHMWRDHTSNYSTLTHLVEHLCLASYWKHAVESWSSFNTVRPVAARHWPWKYCWCQHWVWIYSHSTRNAVHRSGRPYLIIIWINPPFRTSCSSVLLWESAPCSS